MSFIQTLTAMSRPADHDGARVAERLSALFAGARSWIRATRRRCESRLIALAGVVIVLVVAGFTALVVHQIDQTAQKSSEQHVEQLVQAVTYQLGTMMAGIQQTLRYADDEIREYDTPQKLFELTTGGRVSTHLLRDVLFIDPNGRVVVSGLRPNELEGMSDRSDREYFRIHLDGSTSRRPHRPSDARPPDRRGGHSGVLSRPPERRPADGRPGGADRHRGARADLGRYRLQAGGPHRADRPGQQGLVQLVGRRGRAGRRGQASRGRAPSRAGRCGWSPPSTRPRSIARAADRGGR